MLRIISGTAKGHRLKTLKGNSTRPTSDRVKESLFNIIAGYLADAEVLDLYAGTGNLGIEALSRGANFAVFVDKSHECFDIIRENLKTTKMPEKGLILTTDVSVGIQKLAHESRKFDVIFLDPPYNKNLIEETLYLISKNVIMKDDGIVIAERDVADNIPEEAGSLKLVRNQKYGDTILSFYRTTGNSIDG